MSLVFNLPNLIISVGCHTQRRVNGLKSSARKLHAFTSSHFDLGLWSKDWHCVKRKRLTCVQSRMALVCHKPTRYNSSKSSWKESICISVDTEDDLSTLQSVADMLFDMFKDEKDNTVHTGTFLAALMETGLRKNDPRLEEMNRNLMEVHAKLENAQATSISALKLDSSGFKRYIWSTNI